MRRGLSVIAASLVGLAAAIVGAAPASADITLGVGGHVWAYQPTASSYTITGPDYYYAANDGGGNISITRLGTGRYQVRWAGLAAATPSGGGIAHASSYGSSARDCVVAGWWKTGADVVVTVYCFQAGAPIDTQFTANYVSAGGTDSLAYYSYLWADQPSTASYRPASFYSYDSSGTAPWMFRDGVGNYRAYLPSTYLYPDQQTTFYQTTAYGTSDVSCKATGYLGGGIVRVQCRSASGALVDSRFSLTFTTQNLLLRIAPTSMAHVSATPSITWANDSTVSHLYTVTRFGTGSYRLYFPQIASPYGHAVARATGTTDTRCHVSGWIASGNDEYVSVRCFTSTGVAVDTPFVVAFTW